MSDLMDRAVVTMPYDLAMGDELSRMQFWSRVQLVYKELEGLRTQSESDLALMRDVVETLEKWNRNGGVKPGYEFIDSALAALRQRVGGQG